jgi:predicted RNA-binding Zn-ribbon protein involved in translation (DUF1610 family)
MEIDHRYTDQVVCPHCGNKHEEGYEIVPPEDECADFDCEECGKEMSVCRIIDIRYSTKKI